MSMKQAAQRAKQLPNFDERVEPKKRRSLCSTNRCMQTQTRAMARSRLSANGNATKDRGKALTLLQTIRFTGSEEKFSV